MDAMRPAPTLDEQILDARRAFVERFDAPPSIAAFAPGRVNLIGEHTDYNAGFVLPIGIDRRCVAVGGWAANAERSRLYARDLGAEVSIDLREPVAPPSEAVRTAVAVDTSGRPAPWANYLVGVWEEFHAAVAAIVARHGKGSPRRNLDVLITSSVPYGGGLSSSASLEVSFATLLEAMIGAPVEAVERARLCRRAEHRFAGVPCGIMDQYVAVNAVAGRALLIDCQDDTHELVPMPPADVSGAVVMIVNSNVHHELAEGEYAKRHAACRDAARIMGYRSLREVNPYREPAAMGLLPESHADYVRHVLEENIRTNVVASVLREADSGAIEWKRALPEIGQQMVLSHESLRDLYRVSCPELDTLVELAMGASGVYGARMTGGGFGGCVVALVRPHVVESVAARLTAEYQRRHGRECSVYQTVACGGASAQVLK